MRTNNLKAILKAALRVVCILPFAAVVALGQQTVNLTAGPATATLPRWLSGADVGLQLWHGRDWFYRDLRAIECYRGWRLVSRRDHSSRGTKPHGQSHQQSLVFAGG
jgi:hypothetical protein